MVSDDRVGPIGKEESQKEIKIVERIMLIILIMIVVSEIDTIFVYIDIYVTSHQTSSLNMFSLLYVSYA